jgi:hypothetical protein
MPALANKLHEKFSWLIAEGDNATDAYRKINPHVNAPHVLGHKVYHRPEVKSRIAEIREEINTRSILATSRKREILRQMVEGAMPTKVVRNHRNQLMAVFDRLAAMDMDARLAGEYQPQRHELDISDLKLTFKIKSRNTNPSEAMEAEIVTIEEPKQLANAENKADAADPETDVDLSQYASAPMDENQIQLDDL